MRQSWRVRSSDMTRRPPMKNRGIPRARWPRALDDFSAMHEGWLASVDVVGGEFGAQAEVRDLLLVGVSAESRDRHGTITICVAGRGLDQVTRTIHSPTRVLIERTEDRARAALQIRSAEDTITILRLRAPALSPDDNEVARRRTQRLGTDSAPRTSWAAARAEGA
jgi:Family of unknown function (DUF5335)